MKRLFLAMGIPVYFDERARLLGEACGIWPFKRIVLGPQWLRLPWRERWAIVFHEVAHCKFAHMEKRLLLLPRLFLAPELHRRWVRAQEIEADAFAAAQGFGPDMASAIARFDEHRSIFYPSHAERIAALTEGAPTCSVD